jgi:VIT1/CCC1 family predicted Fe2+/Mn2+ transporter
MKTDSGHRAAIILGMHDAIVSLTGLIAGLFFAFTDSNIIIISCIISSVTASLSMGAANYLATKTINRKNAMRSAFFTFAAYMITCVLLILPFFVFKDRSIILSSVVLMAIFIILVFNLCCYRGKVFYKHFFEMLSICTIVSIVAFFIGEIAHQIFGI